MKYKDKGWKVNAVDPGAVITSLKRFKDPDPVESSAIHLVHRANLGPEGPTGIFSNIE